MTTRKNDVKIQIKKEVGDICMTKEMMLNKLSDMIKKSQSENREEGIVAIIGSLLLSIPIFFVGFVCLQLNRLIGNPWFIKVSILLFTNIRILVQSIRVCNYSRQRLNFRDTKIHIYEDVFQYLLQEKGQVYDYSKCDSYLKEQIENLEKAFEQNQIPEKSIAEKGEELLNQFYQVMNTKEHSKLPSKQERSNTPPEKELTPREYVQVLLQRDYGFHPKQTCQFLVKHTSSDYPIIIKLLESKEISPGMLYENFDREDSIHLVDDKIKKIYEEAFQKTCSEEEKRMIEQKYFEALLTMFKELVSKRTTLEQNLIKKR